MLQIENPFPTIFKSALIVQKRQNALNQSYICSQNKQFFALFNNIKGIQEIIVYKQTEGIWAEYFKYDLKKYSGTNLLCFGNNDNQILMYKPITNTIEVLKLEQSLKNGIQNITGVVKDYYKFQNRPDIVDMISSSDGQFIIIKCHQADLLFDVNQVVIITKFQRTHPNFPHLFNFLNFFNDKFIMQVQGSVYNRMYQIRFKNIYNQKMKKLMCLKNIHYQDYYIINNNQSLAFSFFHQNSHIVGQMLNTVNLKIIRKIKIENNQKYDTFLGVVDRYFLIQLISTLNQISYLKIDLFNLQKEEYEFNYHCQCKNEILKVRVIKDQEKYSSFCLRI